MRVTQTQGNLSAHAISGTRVILTALDCPEASRHGLLGFAFKREEVNGPAADWLMADKVFKVNQAEPKPSAQYSTLQNPIQSFLWSDYTAQPGTRYRVTVAAMYGQPGALRQGDTVTFEIKTEDADDGKNGIWFNRGSVASQAFAREFNNSPMTDAIANDPKNKMTAWLSRGLLEACLGFIDAAKQGEGLRVAAYEFTYPPVLAALNDALKRGVDVQIVYHKTPVNDKAVAAAKLPGTKGGKQILFPRTKTKIPHNKFIVHLDRNGSTTAVWTGSTNFTASGFLGQTNVGHLVTDAGVSKTYLAFWKELSGDPILSSARSAAVALTPDPANLIPAAPMTMVYSPRSDKLMLDWYAQRIVDGKTCVAFTGAFGVDATILKGLEQDAQAVRFILLEKPPTTDVHQAEQENHGNLLVSYGAVLGQTYQQVQGAKGGKKLVPIPHFELDKWFLEEELARQDGEGFVFFIHTKFLLVDPLSNDPLVCTGSANFSGNSLTANDENMLQIRGDTRVADIYLTEFDRIFRHFYFRDVANDVAVKGGQSTVIFLKDTDIWTDDYFNQAKFNYHRRLMFFANPANNWTTQAAADPSPFGSGGGQPPKPRGTTARKTGSTRKKATGTAKKKAAPKRKAKKASPRKTKTKKVRKH